MSHRQGKEFAPSKNLDDEDYDGDGDGDGDGCCQKENIFKMSSFADRNFSHGNARMRRNRTRRKTRRRKRKRWMRRTVKRTKQRTKKERRQIKVKSKGCLQMS